MNDTDFPTITITAGAIPVMVNEAEDHLIASGMQVYQRDGKIVRVGSFPIHGGLPSLQFVELNKDALVELFTGIIGWRKLEGKELKPADCPNKVALSYLARAGYWRLPVIRSIITAPTLRADGSVLAKPGYDKTTGLYLDLQGVRFPSIPETPTREEARQALDFILSFVKEVPFVVDEDFGQINRAVFVSGVLSALIRPSLPAVPLHGFNSPTPGTGKSIIVNAITQVMTGGPASPIAQGHEDEMVKALSSALQAGYRVVSFDNCEYPLGGATLCQAVSEPVLSLRVFGRTELRQISNIAMYFATGNNLTMTGDMVRRGMCCTIDARIERPEDRTFKTPRPDLAMARNRAEIVVAGLTVLRAFIAAGSPKKTVPPGGFERWSQTVRDCLLWAGEADPWLTSIGVRSEDPQIANNIAALHAWFETFQDSKMTTKDVVEQAKNRTQPVGSLPKLVNATLHDALQVVANGKLDSQNLGAWLRGIKSRPIGGYIVEKAGMLDGNNRWRVSQKDQTDVKDRLASTFI